MTGGRTSCALALLAFVVAIAVATVLISALIFAAPR